MKNKLRYLLVAVLCISIFAISGCKGGDDGLSSSNSTPIQSGNADSSIENDEASSDENNSSSEEDSSGEDSSSSEGDSSGEDCSSSEDNSSDGGDSSSSDNSSSDDDDSSSEDSGSSGDDSSSEEDPPISNTRTITYILNGGVNHADNLNEYPIDTMISLYEPTRVGFVFDGWYLTEDCTGEPITELSSEYETNVVLYAKWTEKSSELPIRPIS